MPAIARNGPAGGLSMLDEELAILASPGAAATDSSASARASTGRATSGFGSAIPGGSTGGSSRSTGGSGDSLLSVSWPRNSGSLVSVDVSAWSSSASEPVMAGTGTARFGLDVGSAMTVAPAAVLRGLVVLRLLIRASSAALPDSEASPA